MSYEYNSVTLKKYLIQKGNKMEPINTQVEQPTQNSNNSVIYSLIAVIVILLVYIGYIYSSKEVFNKQTMHEQYIKKADITFDALPLYIQNKYVLKSLYDYKVRQLEAKNLNTLKKPEKVVVKKEPKVVEKIIKNKKNNVGMDASVRLIQKEQNSKKKIVSSVPMKLHATKTYTCDTLKRSSEYITKKCKKELVHFLDNNKDAKRFEVIGLIDKQEFTLIEKLKDVYGKKRLGNLAKYAQSGLSRQRVVEASWVMSKHLGSYKQIASVNYTVTKKNKRGFVVKAYK